MSNTPDQPVNELRRMFESASNDDIRKQAKPVFDALEAQLSEQGKREQDLLSQAQRAAIERAFLSRAAKEQVLAPDDAFKLIDATALTLNDSGVVAGLDAIFTQLRRERPYLFARSLTPGLAQRADESKDPAQSLYDKARSSGLTKDIQRWRESRRR